MNISHRISTAAWLLIFPLFLGALFSFPFLTEYLLTRQFSLLATVTEYFFFGSFLGIALILAAKSSQALAEREVILERRVPLVLAGITLVAVFLWIFAIS